MLFMINGKQSNQLNKEMILNSMTVRSMTVGEEIWWLSIQGTICDSDFVSMTVGEENRWPSIQGTLCDSDLASMIVGEEIRCLSIQGTI